MKGGPSVSLAEDSSLKPQNTKRSLIVTNRQTAHSYKEIFDKMTQKIEKK